MVRFGERDRIHEVTQLTRSGGAQTRQCFGARPFNGVAARRHRVARTMHTFTEVVHLFKSASRVHREIARAPQELECSFVRRPIPPALAGIFFWLHAFGRREITRGQCAALFDLIVHMSDGCLPIGAQARTHPRVSGQPHATAFKAMRPPHQPIAADDAGVVGPMFKCVTRGFGVVREHRLRVAVESRVHDEVMRAFDGADAVELDEPEFANDSKYRGARSLRWCACEAAALEQQSARFCRGN